MVKNIIKMIMNLFEDKSSPSINDFGVKVWYNKEGQTHREDGPAVEISDGTKYWYQNGKLHRENGPAQEFPNGTKKWYKYGKLHRDNSPAIIWCDGFKEWFINGKKYSEEEYNKIINKYL